MKSFPIDLPNHNATSELPVRANSAPSPRRSAWQFALFRKYVRRYLRHHFHAVRVSQAGPLPGLLAGPLVVVANHPSWWDPLVGLVFTELMHESASITVRSMSTVCAVSVSETTGVFRC